MWNIVIGLEKDTIITRKIKAKSQNIVDVEKFTTETLNLARDWDDMGLSEVKIISSNGTITHFNEIK